MRSCLTFTATNRTTRVSTEIPHHYYITAKLGPRTVCKTVYCTLKEARALASAWATEWNILEHTIKIERAR